MLKLILVFAFCVVIHGAPTSEKDPMDAGLFEGDIAGVDKNKGLGNIPNLAYTKWPEANGAKAYVPYIITGTFTEDELNVIRVGLEIVENRTRVGNRDCIKFGKRITEENYVNIIRSGGCWSYVGMQRIPGEQALSLDNGCVVNMTVAHEFMHALGIWHEQSRPDRDDYVELDLSVVPENVQGNFDKYTTGVTICNTVYDLKSVMHYDNYAFSTVSGRMSIWAKDGTPLLHTRYKNDISDGDVACLREYYECN